MFIVNFKTYQQNVGEKAVELAKKIESASNESNVPIILCPENVDAKDVMKATKYPVWAQHVDVYNEGQSTGWFPPEIAKSSGFSGTLLNHSEHKLEKHALQQTVEMCKKVGLSVLIFAASQDEAVEVAKYNPDFVAYEPPELVGSQKTSVAESRPETIRKVSEALSIPVLVGAGIKSTQDVKVCLQMGAKGILVSSALVLAEDPKLKAEELLQGFNS